MSCERCLSLLFVDIKELLIILYNVYFVIAGKCYDNVTTGVVTNLSPIG